MNTVLYTTNTIYPILQPSPQRKPRKQNKQQINKYFITNIPSPPPHPPQKYPNK